MNHQASASGVTPTDESVGTPKRIARISKACENCRVRRIRCEPPYPCKACRLANRDDCQVRSKPRPGRTSKEVDTTRVILGTSINGRINAIRKIEAVLEEWFSTLTGETLSLELKEELTHPAMDLSFRIESYPTFTPDCAAALESFLKHVLPFCAYISASRIQHLFQRCLLPVPDLTPDQTALVCICLALGYVRLQYFGESRHAVEVPPDQRRDVFWFRKAVATLESWGDATFTSLHTLAAMWFYASLVGPSRLTRFVITWMISTARDLNINRDFSHTLRSPADKAEAMVSVIVYSHFLFFSCGNQPPLILQGEFFIPITERRDLSENYMSFRGLTYALLSMNNNFLRDLADSSIRDLPIEWLLDVEAKWAEWDKNRHEEVQLYGKRPADGFVRISWYWGHIVIRAAVTDDPRFQVSSSAVMLRAAVEIITNYNEIYTSSPYNLAWQHLRQLSTCAHVILVNVLKGAMCSPEAAPSINTALSLIALSIPRWGSQAKQALYAIQRLSTALNINLDPTYPPVIPNAPPPTTWNMNDFYPNLSFVDVPELNNLFNPRNT